MWTIGKLAKRSEVTTRTIRYYEELALIQPKLRGDNRFRYYDESHFLRLGTIKLLQSLGYGLKDISAALAPLTDSKGNCTPTGQEMAEKISSSLINVREDLQKKLDEIHNALKGIDEITPSLKVCLGCKSSASLEDCVGCERGADPVVQMAHAQQRSKEYPTLP